MEHEWKTEELPELGEEEYKAQVDEVFYLTHAINSRDDRYIVPTVYTLYGDNFDALYVGSSQGLINRLDWHSRKPYWKDIKHIGIRIYPDREQMRIAELAWLFIKKPLYNRDGKYDDDKETIYFNVPGIKFSDNTSEVIYERDELYIGRTED